MASDTKESASNAGDPGLITESGRSPREGDGNPLHCSWKSHGQRSLAGYSPCGSKESDTTEQLTNTFTCSDLKGRCAKFLFFYWCPPSRAGKQAAFPFVMSNNTPFTRKGLPRPFCRRKWYSTAVLIKHNPYSARPQFPPLSQDFKVTARK